MNKKSKTTAGFLGIFLGAYGGHHFYLGNSGKGVLYLLLSLFTGIGVLIFGIIGLVQGVKFLTMTDEEFADYCENLRENDGESAERVGPEEYIGKYKLLQRYKDLYDMGAITDPEFEYFKKQIMRSDV